MANVRLSKSREVKERKTRKIIFSNKLAQNLIQLLTGTVSSSNRNKTVMKLNYELKMDLG
jgi:hypothetical protein